MGLQSVLTVFLAIATSTAVEARSWPDIIDLPIGFFPEGIVLAEGSTVYVGSLLEAGSIWKGNLRTGRGKIVLEDGGGQAVGLTYDRRSGYLFVSGGDQGTARVYDTRTSDFSLVADIALAGANEPTLVNDVIITDTAAFFTETLQPQLYKVPLKRYSGELKNGADTVAETIPLGSGFNFLEGTFNANGIEVTDDGTLLVVNIASGELFTVDPESGEAAQVDLGGVLIHGDGMVLRQNTLWIVEQTLVAGNNTQINEVSLSADLSCGFVNPRALVSEFFDFPGTAVLKGNSLYTLQSKFGVAPEDVATTPYEIVRTDRDSVGFACPTADE